MNLVYENIIEITWIVKEMWDQKYITDIPYEELKEAIIDLSEDFDKIYSDTDWNETDYHDEIIKYTNMGIARILWDRFGDIPIDPDTEEIETEWNGFLKGISREDIWHWFEETFNISVAEDLLGI